MSQIECPLVLRNFLTSLSAEHKAELGCLILQNDDNAITTAMIAVLDPPQGDVNAG